MAPFEDESSGRILKGPAFGDAQDILCIPPSPVSFVEDSDTPLTVSRRKMKEEGIIGPSCRKYVRSVSL